MPVTEAGVDGLAQVVDGGQLAVATDEGLNGHAVGVHADGVLDVNGDALVREVGLEHGGAGGGAKSDGLRDLGRDAGADGAARAHEAVHVGGELREEQVKALEAGRGAHEVAVVEGEHDGVAALGVKDVGEVLLHAPVEAVGALDVEALVVGKRLVDVVVVSDLEAIQISHVSGSFPRVSPTPGEDACNGDGVCRYPA